MSLYLPKTIIVHIVACMEKNKKNSATFSGIWIISYCHIIMGKKWNSCFIGEVLDIFGTDYCRKMRKCYYTSSFIRYMLQSTTFCLCSKLCACLLISKYNFRNLFFSLEHLKLVGGNETRLVAAATAQWNTLPFYHSFWNRTSKPSLVFLTFFHFYYNHERVWFSFMHVIIGFVTLVVS